MRVVTFNVQHGRGADGVVDVDRLVSVCAELRADVLGLQEVDRLSRRCGRRDVPAELARGTGLAMAFASARALDDGSYGNALLVRGTVAEVDALRLPRPWFREQRGALLARVTVAGVSFSVAVTHLGTDQRESGRQLPAVLGALRRLPGPWLLLGDLNRHPAQVARPVAAAGLTLAGGPPTYPAGEPWARIDHVAAAGLRLGDVVVPATPVSDHRPLVVEVAAGPGQEPDPER